MPRFEPFRALRYDTSTVDLADVTAPPYDVLDEADRAALGARHANNVVHVDVPKPSGDDDPYRHAAALLAEWQAAGVLALDDEPTLTLYRLTFTDESGHRHQSIGVLGALGLEPPGEGDVLPHEHTTPKAKSDRLQLLRATATNLSPVWGMSLAAGLTKLLDPPGTPDAAWTDDEGVGHEVWVVRDAGAIEAIADAVGSAPVVIADGHHRYETSLAYRDERRQDGDVPGPYDLVLMFVVELVDDQLTVQPIHRLISGLPDGFDVRAALEPYFEVVETGPPAEAGIVDHLVEVGALALDVPGATFLLHPRAGVFGDAPDLDTSRLDVALATFPPHELTFQHGFEHVTDAVRRGRAQAGVLLRPVSVAQIAATARDRGRMPPKSTFFWPKLKTGIVLRPV
jgi:uncharacterized protein (DUF1015 family)